MNVNVNVNVKGKSTDTQINLLSAFFFIEFAHFFSINIYIFR